jgi:hypothetical protein
MKKYDTFDWKKYKDNYTDLNYIYTKKEAWKHFISYGRKEGREYFYNNTSGHIEGNTEETTGNTYANTDNNEETTGNTYANTDNNEETNETTYANTDNNEETNETTYANTDNNEETNANNKNTDNNEETNANNKNTETDYKKQINLKKKYKKILNIKENFDWLKYVYDNNDLFHLIDEKTAWNHWVLHGQKENRAIHHITKGEPINTSEIHCGRFGNLFFVNMVLHFISKKYNLKTTYKYHEQFKKLGIFFYSGNKTYDQNIYLTELNYFDLINKKKDFTNIIVTNNSWFQNYEFCLYLEIYFNEKKNKDKIIENNKFAERYNNNNDLFVHVRLDDVEKMSAHNSFNYYDIIISKCKFKNGYISSDSLDNLICINLIKKYSLKPVVMCEEETIMFGSTCNNIILSGGTFSWLIGFLAFYSKNINYPKNSEKKWYGNIFVYKDWIEN